MANDFKNMENKDLNGASNDKSIDTMSTNNKENSTVSKKKKEKKRIKATLLLLLIIVMPFILISGIFITTYNVLTADERAEKKEITNKAVEYFSEKYDIKKKDIKIIFNNFYGKDKECFLACDANRAFITYKNEEYIIYYDPYTNTYNDNFQYNRVYEDFLKYLNNRISFATEIKIEHLESDVTWTSQKYEGNLKEYFAKIKASRASKELNTVVSIWLDAQTAEEAKMLKEKYSTEINELINEFEDLKIGYRIIISSKFSNYYSHSFYYYDMYNSKYSFYDNVDNTSSTCDRDNFEGGVCVSDMTEENDV